MNSALPSKAPHRLQPPRPLSEIALLSREERLAGRPKLCSDCGICTGDLRPLMAQSCVFVNNRAEEIERRLHGRNRHDGDELLFGIYRELHVFRMKPPVPGAQWSGAVTSLGALLLERGLVEGVITTGAVPGTRYAPLPILARTPDEVRATRGNKPCLAPTLDVLTQVRQAGLRRIAYIGTGCQVHALRAIEDQLGLERLYVIGIPCTDNTTYPDLQRFLQVVSRSPDTVVHHEFMQDFRIWLKHEDGSVEKVNFVDLDVARLGGEIGVFPPACLSCFDYQNGLSDLTIGYMGAPLPPDERWQWTLVRTERGVELFNLLRPYIEERAPISGGDRTRGMPAYIQMLRKPRRRPPWPIRQLVAFIQRRSGPKGLEFARSVIEMKLLRNLQFVRERHGRLERRIVPGYVYRALARYADVYRREFGCELQPPAR
ncbi:Coenzyme F420 hydrogenase/dehydrogenase, beta subunit C-terminal domain [Chloroflexus aggregans]|uniref:Coenzyme F420 hydrogenase/dehydrogenase beta subunit domain protein n=1 Tax=Chloroflexus aggregans (strain MD-66 / DSM 9485) TaxID=326427 RepID=B8G944_CHLAD|nr:Coenzyme F420 hydrogenase/dehydrogenase, beta subunit C-terminal domain [Chloroflexus aggregans]ACL26319.1 coenzyme F420 hydrogenase/dehydrogenase beta subunit domain protein [Chloroflexus aggregans DSM 9485]